MYYEEKYKNIVGRKNYFNDTQKWNQVSSFIKFQNYTFWNSEMVILIFF